MVRWGDKQTMVGLKSEMGYSQVIKFQYIGCSITTSTSCIFWGIPFMETTTIFTSVWCILIGGFFVSCPYMLGIMIFNFNGLYLGG